MARDVRCTPRKHVVEKTTAICDCGAIVLGPTAAGNADVITLLGTTVPVMVREQSDRIRSRRTLDLVIDH